MTEGMTGGVPDPPAGPLGSGLSALFKLLERYDRPGVEVINTA